jgi:hypothetical protein
MIHIDKLLIKVMYIRREKRAWFAKAPKDDNFRISAPFFPSPSVSETNGAFLGKPEAYATAKHELNQQTAGSVEAWSGTERIDAAETN